MHALTRNRGRGSAAAAGAARAAAREEAEQAQRCGRCAGCEKQWLGDEWRAGERGEGVKAGGAGRGACSPHRRCTAPLPCRRAAPPRHGARRPARPTHARPAAPLAARTPALSARWAAMSRTGTASATCMLSLACPATPAPCSAEGCSVRDGRESRPRAARLIWAQRSRAALTRGGRGEEAPGPAAPSRGLPLHSIPAPTPTRAMSTFGQHFRVTTYGESHCASVGCIVDGVPPGMTLRNEDVQVQLSRRRPGQSDLTTPVSAGERRRGAAYRRERVQCALLLRSMAVQCEGEVSCSWRGHRRIKLVPTASCSQKHGSAPSFTCDVDELQCTSHPPRRAQSQPC